MGKKRGGKRGRPEEGQPEPGPSTSQPWTSQQPQQPSRSLQETQYETRSRPSVQEQPESASEVQRGRGRPYQQSGGRGRGRGAFQETTGRQESSPSAWGQQRGRGRGTGQQYSGGRGRGRGSYHQEHRQSGAWGRETPKSWSSSEDTSAVAQKVETLSLTEAPSRQLRAPELVPRSTLADEEFKKLLPYKPGTAGRKILIETNHLQLNLGTLQHAFRYDVSIEPDKPKKMCRKAMELFRKAHFPNNFPSYDGQKLMYSAKKLPIPEDTISGSVNVTEDSGKDKEFKISIKLTGILDLSPLNLNNLLQKNVEQGDAFQCVEVVFRQAYMNSFVNVGRKFYTPPVTRGQYFVGDGAEMYLGGYQATVKGYKHFLNVDVAHKAFTMAVNVKDLANEMFNRTPLRDDEMRNFDMKPWQREQMTSYLKGLKVIYQIPNHPGSKKVYKVNSLERPPNRATFKENNQETTVEKYYQKKYHYTIKYPNLPTLWVGAKGNILIPMECCTLKEGQPIEGNKMRDTQVSKMIRYAATSTTERKKKIQNIINTAGYNRNPYINEFGFSVADEFQKVVGRVLDPPKLQYYNDTVVPTKGVWRGKQFQQGAQIRKWTVVAVGLQRDRVHQDISRLAKMIHDFGRDNGMVLARPVEPFDYRDPRDIYRSLQEKNDCDLIIVVINSFNKDLYYVVKQVAEQSIGCLTQCIKSDTLRKLNPVTIVNILLKVNSKLNGTNHTISNLDLLSKEPVMVMGADVTHPSPQAKSLHPSVVAVTASHNLAATAYNVNVTLQKPRETMSEIIQDLEEITVIKLHRFKKNTGKDPSKIFFFRDGVSDGEFERVRENEIKAIERACARFRRGFRPKITFLVVQKRHHTRFFPMDQSGTDGDRNFNAPAGTCVDTEIVDPSRQNFYLLSHASIQGVARPTKYCTLHDENDLSNDDVQKLTYYLCHIFVRCNRAVSYPAPTYYAHLMADRAKGYLHGKQINMDKLDQKLIMIKENFIENNPMFFS